MTAANHCQSLSQADFSNTSVSLSPVSSSFTQILSSISSSLLIFQPLIYILIGELFTIKMLQTKNTCLAFFLAE